MKLCSKTSFEKKIRDTISHFIWSDPLKNRLYFLNPLSGHEINIHNWQINKKQK